MRRYILLLLLVLLSASFLLGCGSRNNKVQEQDAAAAADTGVQAEESLVLNSAEAKLLQYCDGEITVRFALDESGAWYWVDEPTFPLNGTRVDELMAALTALAPIQSFSPDSLEPYGLDAPRRYVSVDSELVQDTMYIGNQAEDGSWYMTMSGSDQVHTIPDEFVQLLSISVYDMAILPVLPTVTEESLLSVSVGSGENRVSLRKINEDWKGTTEEVTARLDKVVAALSTVQITRCFDFLPSQRALELTGFSTPTAEITVDYINSVGVESSFTITLGALHSTEEGYYATINDDSTIYLIPSVQVSPLLVLLIYSK